MASRAARPARSDSQPHRDLGTSPGLTRTDIHSPADGGLTHSRPCLPRPAVCSSATTQVPSGASDCTSRATSAFVEVVVSRMMGIGTGHPASASNVAIRLRSKPVRSTDPERSIDMLTQLKYA